MMMMMMMMMMMNDINVVENRKTLTGKNWFKICPFKKNAFGRKLRPHNCPVSSNKSWLRVFSALSRQPM